MTLAAPAAEDAMLNELMPVLKRLFDSNRAWSRRIQQQDPDFFVKLSQQAARFFQREFFVSDEEDYAAILE